MCMEKVEMIWLDASVCGVSGNDLVGHSCVWSEWKESDWTLVCME